VSGASGGAVVAANEVQDANGDAQGPLEAPRFTCAFGGAYAATVNLERAIPIGHAGGGCIFQQVFGTNLAAGAQGVGYIGGSASPSCNLSEKEVIFGGAERLKEQVEATLELVDGDVYVILGACIPALVGDDVPSVLRELRSRVTHPILYVDVPGFAGNSYLGYERFLLAAIDQLLAPVPEKSPRLVNVLGVPPNLNPYWKGTLKVIRRVLKRVGVETNLVFGRGGGLAELQRLPAAALTLVLSPWLGVQTARALEDRFQVPWVRFPSIPIGPAATSELLRLVAERLELDRELVDRVIGEEQAEADHLLDVAGDTVAMLSPSLHLAVVADSATAVGVTRFMVEEAGFYPVLVVITDDPPEEAREQIRDQLGHLAYGLAPEVRFEVDTFRIQEVLKDRDYGLLLASSLEKFLAKEKKAFYLNISYPAHDRLLLDRTYAGFGGGAILLEDVFALLLEPF
jgi:nitrogenase molybdenum-iron protein beta chain